ncbi:hypothetical protein Syun_011448 [Stephania yunnanensis]|uniref:Uncharacterized protein n=1 Tax=Stephania yunnanensis TaxID=152371 RepID=A0AAP0JXJ7_9MAGN
MGLKSVVIAVDGSEESISAAQAVPRWRQESARRRERRQASARAASGKTTRAATGERESGDCETARWWRRRVWRLAGGDGREAGERKRDGLVRERDRA